MTAGDVRVVELKNPTTTTISGAISTAVATGGGIEAGFFIPTSLDMLFFAWIEAAP